MGLITVYEYPSIRRLLDLSLSAEDLPDAVIDDPLFLDVAEAWLAAAIPTSETLEGDALARAKRAIALYTASLIAPSLPSLTAATVEGTGSYQRKAVDWSARAAELRSAAAEALASVLPGDPIVPAMPTFFAVASGCRGR